MRRVFYSKADRDPRSLYSRSFITACSFPLPAPYHFSNSHPFAILFTGKSNDLKGRHITNCCYGLSKSLHPP